MKKNIGKIICIVKILNNEDNDLGLKMAMHIAASNPLSIDKNDLKKEIIDKRRRDYKGDTKLWKKR